MLGQPRGPLRRTAEHRTAVHPIGDRHRRPADPQRRWRQPHRAQTPGGAALPRRPGPGRPRPGPWPIVRPRWRTSTSVRSKGSKGSKTSSTNQLLDQRTPEQGHLPGFLRPAAVLLLEGLHAASTLPSGSRPPGDRQSRSSVSIDTVRAQRRLVLIDWHWPGLEPANATDPHSSAEAATPWASRRWPL